jgi:hypothetical protein
VSEVAHPRVVGLSVGYRLLGVTDRSCWIVLAVVLCEFPKLSRLG